jgi:hypothetical protein
MKQSLKILFFTLLATTMACKKDKNTPAAPSLEGEWSMDVNINKSRDWKGAELPPTPYKTAKIQIKLSVINGQITGNYIITTGACVNTSVTGTILKDNTFEMTTLAKGSCCDNAQMTMKGKLISNDAFEATTVPLNIPPYNCYTWWADIKAQKAP